MTARGAAKAGTGTTQTTRTPRTRAKMTFPEETTQQRKERLYAELDDLDRQISILMEKRSHKENELNQLIPPLIPNQKVLNPVGGIMVVLNVERAFGEWVARVRYDTGQKKVDMGETYIFSCSNLRPLDEVPTVELPE